MDTKETKDPAPQPPFLLYTDAMDQTGVFDARYTCDGDNSSPELRWINPPRGTASFAVLIEDAGAAGGAFTNWLIHDIPETIFHLPAGIPAQEQLPNGIRQGVNSLKRLGYGGPCPPHGDAAHSYTIKLYALSAKPEIPPRASRDAFLQGIQPLILGTAFLRGRYARQPQQAAVPTRQRAG